MSHRQLRRRVLDAVATSVLVLGLAGHLARNTGNPLDFHTYYYAAAAELHGLDPYRIESLWVAAGKGVELPFLYPPVTFVLFVPLTLLPMAAAGLVWLVLKLLMVAALVVIWKRWFLRDISIALLVAMTFLGFNGSIVWDLTTGNVSVVEQFLLWIAFACYVVERRRPFAVLVAIAAVFKFLPIVLLGLLLVPSKRHGRSIGLALAGLGLFGVLVFLSSVLGLDWAHGFLPALPRDRPLGEINPCALGVLDTWIGPVRWSGGQWSVGAGYRAAANGAPDLALGLWGVYCIALLVTSRSMLMRVWARRDPVLTVAVGSMAFALLSPRMMVYSYILLVAPALLLVRNQFPAGRIRDVAIAAIVIQFVTQYLWRMTSLRMPANSYVLAVALMNLSFFVTLGIWQVLVRTSGEWPASARDAGVARARETRVPGRSIKAVRPSVSR